MRPNLFLATLILAGYVLPAAGVTLTRRATMVGGGGTNGKCTIQVDVDGAAEVAVSGDTGRLRTLSGQTAQWRRFECNGQIPRNPADFRFRGIDGRGDVNLVSDPRNTGVAVVRINDPKGGSEGYTFDLEWTGGSYGGLNDGYGYNRDRYSRDDYRYNRDDNRYNRNDRLSPNDYGYDNGRQQARAVAGQGAIRACRDAITDRINRDGYTRVNIVRIVADDNPGRNDYLVGTATARGRSSMVDFSFSCNMNFDTGRVRSVQLNAR